GAPGDPAVDARARGCGPDHPARPFSRRGEEPGGVAHLDRAPRDDPELAAEGGRLRAPRRDPPAARPASARGGGDAGRLLRPPPPAGAVTAITQLSAQRPGHRRPRRAVAALQDDRAPPVALVDPPLARGDLPLAHHLVVLIREGAVRDQRHLPGRPEALRVADGKLERAAGRQ